MNYLQRNLTYNEAETLLIDYVSDLNTLNVLP